MRRGTFYKLFFLAVALALIVSSALHKLLNGLPDIDKLQNYVPPLTSYVYDKSGAVISEFSIQRRALLPLDKIPADLQNAVIATEDDRFYSHWGISPRGMLRAAVADVLSGHFRQGGSTLTQQVSKQIFLTPKKTLARKIREVLLAVEMERNFSKQEILQIYLNQVYFGEGAYGVESAARIYFGKDIARLTLDECALLAGLIQSPQGNSPFLHPNRARMRRGLVLERMRAEGMITPQEEALAQNEPLPTEKPAGFSAQAPYFVEYIRQKMERKYVFEALWRGGLKIYTTLDLGLQNAAEDTMEKRLSEFDAQALKRWQEKISQGRMSGVETSTQPPAEVQGAFIALDVKSGAVRAMVGGRKNSIFNRVLQARRQPGSTFKAFVWTAALESGMTAASLVDDSPLSYYYDGRDWRLLEGATDQLAVELATASFAQNPDFKIWVPTDFDNKYMGLITLRTAISESRNVASVRLIEKVGPPLVVEIAHKVGIASYLDPVLSLGLGSSVVSPLEMANAFETFANGGIHETPYTIERVEAHDGTILETHLPSEQEAISPQLAYLVTDMLRAVVQSGTGRYARALHRPTAGKTGTTNENRDLWFVGYTPDLAAAAWMGYDDFSSLGKSTRWTGGSTVLPWWTEIMTQALKDHPKRDFTVPSGIVFKKLDTSTGMLALPTCPRRSVALVAFAKDLAPKKYCDINHSKPIDPQLRQELGIATSSSTAMPTALTAQEIDLSDSTQSVYGIAPSSPAAGVPDEDKDNPDDPDVIQ
ncbi:MAG: penicillin-binding protein 1A [Elusimicrobiota bacterium]